MWTCRIRSCTDRMRWFDAIYNRANGIFNRRTRPSGRGHEVAQTDWWKGNRGGGRLTVAPAGLSGIAPPGDRLYAPPESDHGTDRTGSRGVFEAGGPAAGDLAES